MRAGRCCAGIIRYSGASSAQNQKPGQAAGRKGDSKYGRSLFYSVLVLVAVPGVVCYVLYVRVYKYNLSRNSSPMLMPELPSVFRY